MRSRIRYGDGRARLGGAGRIRDPPVPLTTASHAGSADAGGRARGRHPVVRRARLGRHRSADIARAAEVSVETVYATFGSKADLLKAALEVAIVGDDAQVPLADRPVYTAIGTGRTTGDRIESGARLIATINERTHRLAVAIRQGATTDATLAAVAADLEGQRRRAVADVADLIVGRHADPGQVDELWVQAPRPGLRPARGRMRLESPPLRVMADRPHRRNPRPPGVTHRRHCLE